MPSDTEHNSAIRLRFEEALGRFVDKLRPDPNVIAVILCGSLANDTVWEKSDMDVNVLVKEMKLSTSSFCVEEDGLILNVDVSKAFDFKRGLESGRGDMFNVSYYNKAQVVYTVDDSIREYIDEAREMGEDDRVLSIFKCATYLIGDMEKIEKWLTVKNDLLYAQYWILKAADIYANMVLALDRKPTSREAVLKVMEYAPEKIERAYVRPMMGSMGREEILDTLAIYKGLLVDNVDLIKQPVIEYMSDGEARTVTTLAKKFGLGSHAIYHVFDFLAEMDVVVRVTENSRLTPKSRMAMDEVAFMYINENQGDAVLKNIYTGGNEPAVGETSADRSDKGDSSIDKKNTAKQIDGWEW